jgi:chemotaxis protein CheX
MNLQIQSLDCGKFLVGHLVDVFETMLSLKATPSAGAMPLNVDRVTGSVGFGGENVTGAVYLHLSSAFAVQAAAAMLGLAAEELGEAEVNDVIGELTNMLCGGLKSALCDAGSPCAVSTPGIIRGAFEIEVSPEVQRERFLFDCGGERLAVELHIKSN